MAYKFALGAEVKDKLSGYRGLITSRSEHLYGCLRYSVMSASLDKDGVPLKGLLCDEGSLEYVGPGLSADGTAWTAEAQKGNNPGGPNDVLPGRETVSR